MMMRMNKPSLRMLRWKMLKKSKLRRYKTKRKTCQNNLKIKIVLRSLKIKKKI